jgi:signal transduction histidine kinase/ligand-binding sensor domain-containing protein
MCWNWAQGPSRSRAPVLRLLAALAVLLATGAGDASAQVIGRARYFARGWPLLGESSTVVEGMAIDSLGYLHLATGAGLLRFDGRRVARQTINDLPLLESNKVSCLAADAEGVWIGTPEGRLLRVVRGRVRDSLAPFADVGEGVSRIAILPGGDLLAGSPFRVRRFREGRWTELKWPPGALAPEAITAFAVTRRGTIYAATNHGLRRATGDAFERVTLPGASWRESTVRALAEDAHGDLWISTRDGLFVRTASGDMVSVPRPPALSGVVEALVSDEEGTLWFGGGFGLVAARVHRGTSRPSLEPVFELPYSQTEGVVRQLVSDGRGTIVAAGSPSAIRIVVRSPVRVIDVKDGLPMSIVHHVVGAGDGGLWVGTACDGVTRVDSAGLRQYRRGELGMLENCVRSLMRDTLGALWIGQRQTVSRVSADGDVLIARVGDDGVSQAGPMLADGAGGIWLGRRPHGLTRVDQQGRVTVPPEAQALEKGPVWSLARDAAGRLWVGQVGTATRFDASGARTFGAADGVPSGPLRVLLPDPDGTLWLVSYGGGLARYRDGRFQRLTMRDGLFDDALSAIVPDNLGRLWLMGNRGVSVVRRSQVDSVLGGLAGMVDGVTLGNEVGVPEGNGGFPAGWTDGRQFYFASVDGLTIVDPRALGASRAAPRAIFESVVTAEGERPIQDDILSSTAAAGRALRVTAPAIAGPDIRLRYRVVGARNGWVEVGSERLVPLPALGPGQHTIELGVREPSGAWSAQPTTLALDVRGLWWQRWSFRLLLLGLVVAGVVAVMRSRLAAAEARANELRGEILRRERAEAEAQQRLHELAHLSRVAFAGELATSIAHELNQPLAAIVSNADAARRMLTVPKGPGSGEDVDDVLRDISAEGKRASGVIRTLREFLRRGKGEHVPVDLAETIGEVLPVLRHVLERHRVTVVVNGVTALPRVLGDRIALQQVLMNLIMNAAEAMQAVPEDLRLIAIEGRQERDRVLVCVRDRGPGVAPVVQQSIFEPFASTKPEGMGMGLAISRSIVDSHDGELTVGDAPDGGAVFCVSLPVAAEDD